MSCVCGSEHHLEHHLVNKWLHVTPPLCGPTTQIPAALEGLIVGHAHCASAHARSETHLIPLNPRKWKRRQLEAARHVEPRGGEKEAVSSCSPFGGAVTVHCRSEDSCMVSWTDNLCTIAFAASFTRVCCAVALCVSVDGPHRLGRRSHLRPCDCDCGHRGCAFC